MEPCRRENSRDAILDAGYEALGRLGYNKMSVDAVSKLAGVSRAAIYLHFANKQELALAVVDRKNEQLFDELRVIARGKSTPVERVRRILHERVMIRIERVRDHARCLDELMAAVRQPLLARREKYNAREAGILAEVLVEGRLKGVFEFDDAHQTAATILAATNSLLPHSLSARELEFFGQVEVTLSRISDMVLKAISVQRAPSDRLLSTSGERR